ncbi:MULTISPECIES: restriction endonuclease subunit S [Bacillati]|uniref:restriction endonuclease subunit S n=1 Tax=Bacillati TaxID=1783272 RepID=UPI00051CD5F4|nr:MULTISPECIES: restriction endonuclease subunit S [Terrabacteria group]KGI99873.1 hypothetical protein ES20_08980 [Rothia aeria]KGJ31556.1 hypothetical protein ES18_11555 [Rothia aeria]
MKLDFSQWHEFVVASIFDIHNGRGITAEEIAENPGVLNAVQSGEEHNGVIGRISADYCREMQYVFTLDCCLTVARTGTAGFVSFQADGCVVGDSAKLLLLRHQEPSPELYLFLQTILSQNRFKYSYGRKVTEAKYMGDVIDLPIKHDSDGSPVIDPAKTYSPEGYIPDWQFMENFIHALHYKPLTTENSVNSAAALNVVNWKSFTIGSMFDLKYGVNLALNACVESESEEAINFVSRTESNNGVSARVERVPGVEPQEAGLITVATGGSVLSTFVQPERFYSGRDLYVLNPKEDRVGLHAKLFLTTVIEANKFKFSYGRQANKSLPDIELQLPIQRDETGNPVIDPTKQYHTDGYMPDWQFMEDYVRSLPYGDRIPK